MDNSAISLSCVSCSSQLCRNDYPEQCLQKWRLKPTGSFKLTNVEMSEPSDLGIREELSNTEGILVGVVGDTFQMTFGAPSRLGLCCILGIVYVREIRLWEGGGFAKQLSSG